MIMLTAIASAGMLLATCRMMTSVAWRDQVVLTTCVTGRLSNDLHAVPHFFFSVDFWFCQPSH